jgi:hypothetical protein
MVKLLIYSKISDEKLGYIKRLKYLYRVKTSKL